MNDFGVVSSLFQDKQEEPMVKEWEELGDVKYQHTCCVVSSLS